MPSDRKQSYYEVLDVSFNANPEVIRTSYIRAKNAYNRDSLAAYSLFDKEESRRILDEIEEAYTILSDSEKRRRYDESHGIISSESVYESYHRGNHAVAAFSRSSMDTEDAGFALEDDPFRHRSEEKRAAEAQNPVASAASGTVPTSGVSHIDRLRAMAESAPVAGAVKNYQVSRSFQADPEMEEKIKNVTEVTGPFLKSVREYKTVTQDEIMNILKISKNYLNALEDDDFKKLPANVFVRGFVLQYAKALRLDQDKIATAYMEYLKKKRP
jgi:curved DNA-binding protein CbpA